jgi:hypothetical protein
MKKITILVLSHAIVFSSGYAVHRMAVNALAEHSSRHTVAASAPPRALPQSVPSTPTTSGIRSGEERKALDAIRNSALNDHQKRFLRDRILLDWMARNPRSALMMLAEEGSGSDFRNRLTREAVKGREEEMLDWIMNGDFGLSGAEILRAWGHQVASIDGNILFMLIPKVPGEFRSEMLGQLFGPSNDPQVLEARIGQIQGITDEQLRLQAWKAALSGAANGPTGRMEDPTRFLALMARKDVPPEARAEGLNRFAYGLMANQSRAEAAKFFSMLPAEDQAAMSGDLLKAARTAGMLNSSAYLSALTMVSGSGQWEMISAEGPKLVDAMYERHPGTAASASRWALQLPERKEAVSTYRRIVGGMFKQGGADEANIWIDALPEGWHKDQAYAQLAITSEHHYKNAGQRDAAIDRVKDPGIRADLDAWRETRKK